MHLTTRVFFIVAVGTIVSVGANAAPNASVTSSLFPTAVSAIFIVPGANTDPAAWTMATDSVAVQSTPVFGKAKHIASSGQGNGVGSLFGISHGLKPPVAHPPVPELSGAIQLGWLGVTALGFVLRRRKA